MVSITQLQEIPPKNMILLVGPPGSGKTTFCQQSVLQNLAVDRPIIYVTTECGPSEAEKLLKEGGLGEIEPGLLNFVDAYNETVGLSIPDRPDTVHAHCEDLSSIGIAISKLQDRIGRKGALLVFDSLTSPYLFGGSEVLRFMRRTLSGFAAKGNSVLVLMDEGCAKEEDLGIMMSMANGIIRMEVEEGSRVLNVVKHPVVKPTRIEVPMTPSIELKAFTFVRSMVRRYMQATTRKDEAWLRKEIGDFVNLFWPNFAHWSGMLWDPKRFPTMIYEINKGEPYRMIKEFGSLLFPWKMRLLFRLFMPKSFSRVKDMKKLMKSFEGAQWERTGIVEYLDDVSKTDEHYIRVHENFDCWGLENVGDTTASHLPPLIAGMCKALEKEERNWNALETKCLGLGDPYCEFKLVPGEINGLKASLEKDASVLERINERFMSRLMEFLLNGKPLVERPRLGRYIHLHPVMHAMGFPHVAGERYRMALQMGGARSGKEVGERLMDAGLRADDAAQRVFYLLEHCKVGKVVADETIRIEGNCESIRELVAGKREEPSCYFTTGFFNGFFSSVTNQHVKEIKCIAMGDPYCAWEFR